MERGETSALRAELNELREAVGRIGKAIEAVTQIAKAAPAARTVRSHGTLKPDEIRKRTNAMVGRLVHL